MTKCKVYKPRLQVFILQHPDSVSFNDFPERIYSFFTRNLEDPLSRGLGIPVFIQRFIESPNSEKVTFMNPDNANHTVYVILIDCKIVNSFEWCQYIIKLRSHIKNSTTRHLLIPIDTDDTGKNLDENLRNEVQFVRINSFPEGKKFEKLIIRLTHEFCRLLQIDFDGYNDQKPPIKLFLSHAKADGKFYVDKFLDYLSDEKSGVKTFFDVSDIPIGSEFEKAIQSGIKKAALLVFQSDKYSSREWCRREVLLAKKYCCPIVIVNCLMNTEDRSFPYIANVPSIRWNTKDDSRFNDILILALRETLQNFYNIHHLETLISSHERSGDFTKWYRAPEMLTCLHLFGNIKEGESRLLLYPDPPLGVEELELLRKMNIAVKFLTPAQLLGQKFDKETNLDSTSIIGISIGKHQNFPLNGLTHHHMKDTMVEFARYMLSAGLFIMYGGDLRRDGFTHILFDLVRQYSKFRRGENHRILNYLAWPYSRDLTEEMQALLKPVAEIRKINLPDDLLRESNRQISADKVEDRYLMARALTKMRKEMCCASHARIMLGGKTKGYSGLYPGLVEEAYLSLKAKKPIFLIGSFGGATRSVIDALKGKSPEILTLKKQMEDTNNGVFINFYNDLIANNSSITENFIDYESIVKFFQTIGIEGLNNGLTDEENIQLFETLHIHEMISLILKGLSNLALI